MKSFGSIASLSGVLLLHAAVLSLFLVPSTATPEMRVHQPSVQGILIAASASAVAPLAQRVLPKEVPKPTPKYQPPSKPKPLHKPAPSKPKSVMPAPNPVPEKAIARPTPPASVPLPAPAAPPVPPSEHVEPPRSDASHLRNQAPVYPMASRRLREQGTVLVELTVLPDGKATEVTLKKTSGYRRLDEAALQAVRLWKFVPAKRGAVALAWRYVQPIHFSLN